MSDYFVWRIHSGMAIDIHADDIGSAMLEVESGGMGELEWSLPIPVGDDIDDNGGRHWTMAARDAHGYITGRLEWLSTN